MSLLDKRPSQTSGGFTRVKIRGIIQHLLKPNSNFSSSLKWTFTGTCETIFYQITSLMHLAQYGYSDL